MGQLMIDQTITNIHKCEILSLDVYIVERCKDNLDIIELDLISRSKLEKKKRGINYMIIRSSLIE